MFRTLSVIVAVMIGVLFAPTVVSAQTIELGKTFEGELGGKKTGRNIGGKDNVPLRGFFGYTGELHVALKAGQTISISASVTGKGREVYLILRDPTGQEIGITTEATPKTSRLKVEEVSATGRYTIVVVSDRIGPFTLRATVPSGGDADVKKLEEKVKRLKQELKEAEEELEKARKKKS